MSGTDSWTLIESPLRIEHNRAYEGLFTLGSGYLHVRGSLEEHVREAPQNVEYDRVAANVTSERFPQFKARWGTYVPGVFGPHPTLNNQMINLPWFLELVPTIDGERLDPELGRFEAMRRELSLAEAVLRRPVRWTTRTGVGVTLRFERFISAARPHLCVQRLTVESDRDCQLEVRGGIDADVRTNGFDHFSDVAFEAVGLDGIAARVRTDGGDLVTIRTRWSATTADDEPAIRTWEFQATPRHAWRTGSLRMRRGRPLHVEKRTVVLTSRDRAPLDAGALREALNSRGYEALLAEHRAVWQARWDACDVVIEGDPASQLAMRLALYHLLRCHVAGDPRVAIDAKGYAGEAYWGRYFWDTEVCLLPFFLYTAPEKARTLADFRVQSLPGARSNAQRYGYPGARYAWESDAGGLECCPNWQYADHEVHVTADVVYGLAHYAAAADGEYLRGPAGVVLVETARYWMERVDWVAGPDGTRRPALLGVMGPDEYKPITRNNAFTNRMVAFALARAAEVGGIHGASGAELAAWRKVAAELPIPRRADGLVLQCEEFESFAEPEFEKRWTDRQKPFAACVSQERLYRSKCLKQADVLMLMALFPHEFSDEQVRQAWEFYLPYTTHDSSLSPGAHGIVACRLGLDERAWEFWQRTARIDLDVARGGAAEGVHIAAAGLLWQTVVLGFAGMRTALQADVLTLGPRLPAAWKRLAFPLVWRGTPVRVEISPGCVRVTNRGAAPLVARVGDQERRVEPRESVEFAVRG
jgi:kojibiose phosphorylase